MQLIFIICATSGLLYILLAKRTFDLYSVAYVGSCVYFMPGFFGHLPDGANRQVAVDVHPETYWVMLVVLAGILAGAVVYDSCRPRSGRIKTPKVDRLMPRIALAIALLGLAITVRSSGSALFSPYKHVLMETLTRWYILWIFGASVAAVTSFLQRQWCVLTASGLLLMFDMYIGFRASSAMTVIAICMLHLGRQGPRRMLAENWRFIAVSSGAPVVFFVYKRIYRLMKIGEFSIVSENLGESDFYLQALLQSEPFTTQSILNAILGSDFRTGWDHLVSGLLHQFIPFLSGDRTTFNALFQDSLYRDRAGGMGANIWAEMIAVAGWPLFLAFLLLFVFSLGMGHRLLRIQNLSTRATMALALSYWVFYIHRNELSYQINLEKRVLLVWVVCVLGSMVFSGQTRRRPMQPAVLVRRAA